MSDSEATIPTYHARASELAALYDNPAILGIDEAIASMLPEQPFEAVALDVGAGSGRDAAWLADRGYDVVAVEPATAMLSEGARRHPDATIRWLDDRLPSLSKVHALGIAFDVILVAAVWQHVAPNDRPRAFRKLSTLLKPGGLMILTLREGLSPPDRTMFPVSLGEIEALSRSHGIEILRSVSNDDRLGRSDITWTSVIMRMPDEGSGALPIIRGIILSDDKSSTYKLALLRAVARVADVASAAAKPKLDEPDTIEIPLGLVALNWVRMYLPLVRAELPQAPRNIGVKGLGFAKSGFRALMAGHIAPPDLRPGANFNGDRARAVQHAINEAAATISAMPANFTRFPNVDRPIFRARRTRFGQYDGSLSLSTLKHCRGGVA